MKKIFTMMLALSLAVGLSGCGGGDGGTADSGSENKLVVYSPNSDGLINAVVPAF